MTLAHYPTFITTCVRFTGTGLRGCDVCRMTVHTAKEGKKCVCLENSEHYVSIKLHKVVK